LKSGRDPVERMPRWWLSGRRGPRREAAVSFPFTGGRPSMTVWQKRTPDTSGEARPVIHRSVDSEQRIGNAHSHFVDADAAAPADLGVGKIVAGAQQEGRAGKMRKRCECRDKSALLQLIHCAGFFRAAADDR